MRPDQTPKSRYTVVRGKLYETFRFSTVSMETLEMIGQEPNDAGREVEALLGDSAVEYLLNCRTQRQRTYAQLLSHGYSYREIGERLGVHHQAVKQIIQRIRIRLKSKCTIST
jgi:DNA-directed RNA polymerase specialized sigma24 family protein